MTRTSKIVRIYFYLYDKERTIIDSFEADDWGDFLVVRVKGLDDEGALQAYETMRENMAQLNPSKQFIIVPDNLDIDLYGVEVSDDQN